MNSSTEPTLPVESGLGIPRRHLGAPKTAPDVRPAAGDPRPGGAGVLWKLRGGDRQGRWVVETGVDGWFIAGWLGWLGWLMDGILIYINGKRSIAGWFMMVYDGWEK